MSVPVETAIEGLLPRALQDPELAPKLDEHQLTEADLRATLTDNSAGLARATGPIQREWDAATEACREIEAQLSEHNDQPSWYRLALAAKRWLPFLPISRPEVVFGSETATEIAGEARPVPQAPKPRELAELLLTTRKRESEIQAEWWESAYINWVRQQVTALINEHEDPSYRSKLPAKPGSGLAEGFHPEYEVETAVGAKLSGLFTYMPGGSIGLCGFRGSGKTTLISSLCKTQQKTEKSEPSLGFMVSAPVRYEPRDFVLYLFARLCQEILGIAPGREPGNLGVDSVPAVTKRTAVYALLGGGLVALATGIIDLVATFSSVDLHRVLHSFTVQIIASVGLVCVGLGLLYLSYRPLQKLWWGRLRRRGERHRYLAFAIGMGITYEVQDLARRWLSDIQYQLSYTSGWSGSLNISVAQASASRSTQVEERQRTLPGVIAGYRNLAEAVSQAGVRLFIGIDELDKISSAEDAERFLNEVKSIFGISGCFYLVSVSENAMSSFERRGLPFRDVFDSTFDEIVRIERFSYAQSRLLIRRRTIIPEPFIAVCHCVSGGLPRDLIRAARTLYRLNSEHCLDGSLRDVTRALITEDLHAKTAASWVELMRINIEPEATLFKSWFKRVTGEPADEEMNDKATLFPLIDGDTLYQQCAEFWREAQKWPNSFRHGNPQGDGTLTDTESSNQRELLGSLALEINAYRYLAASIVQFFGSQPSDSALREAGDPRAGKASFERLAEARLLFVNSPLLAWTMISDFRGAHSMGGICQPDPCWPRYGWQPPNLIAERTP